MLHVEDDAIRLELLAAAIERVQAEVRRYVPEGVDVAAELSEDRRREGGQWVRPTIVITEMFRKAGFSLLRRATGPPFDPILETEP